MKFIKIVAQDYDHEEQTHDHQPFHYGGKCRVCGAEELIRKFKRLANDSK